MGWLELLPLLKRILPLLSRVAPMLETVVASRAASRAGTDGTLDRLLEEVKTQQLQHGEGAAALQRLLEAQTARVDAVAVDTAALRHASDTHAAKLVDLERQVSAVHGLLRLLGVATLVLLLACVGLLVLLLVRKA